MLEGLDAVVDDLETAGVDEARAVLSTGAGEGAFSAGADLRVAGENHRDAERRPRETVGR